ncbi:MAG: hypothetical protein KF734_13665 [Saprospiraceae bacterium]|nr:hypothetical protein [Saprospiraceae bacterium]
MTHSKNKRKQSYLFRNLAYVFVGIALFSPAIPYIVPSNGLSPFSEYTLETWSNLGEFVGGMGGTLLSFAGILLILQTISDQQREMREMRLMHEEQQFEATFFQALNGHNELVKSFELPLPGGKWANGRICLRYLYREFEEKCKGDLPVEQIFERFIHFSQSDQLIIRQFLQSIEKLVSFTHKAEVQDQAKRNLLDFISAQLTYHEEFFFLLYLASKRGDSALTDFVVQYRLFDCHAEQPFSALNHTPFFYQSM